MLRLIIVIIQFLSFLSFTYSSAVGILEVDSLQIGEENIEF